MTIEAVPPGLLLILGALALPLLRGHARDAVTLLLPLAVLAYVWRLPEGVLLQFGFLGLNVEPVEVDALSRLFATIFAIMAPCTLSARAGSWKSSSPISMAAPRSASPSPAT